MRSVIVLAGGTSSRFEGNKMLAEFAGRPLIAVTVSKFVADEIILVAHPDNIETVRGLFPELTTVPGGETRTLSVLNGLNAVSEKSNYVAIHDGARPFVSGTLIEAAFSEASKFDNAVPAIKMTDSAYIGQAPLERGKIRVLQTPQVFDTKMIKEAYGKRDLSKAYGDDSEVFLECFGYLHFIEGEPSNRKITYASDLPDYRIGNGYDVHRLVEGRKLILGGVEIPHTKGLLGHSDADAVIHAITDSLLSAVGERDIGVQFPDTDAKYKNISSLKLLEQVKKILKNAQIQNVSCVIIAQEPKLAAYIPQMCKKIAASLEIGAGQVSISATTTEKLGVIGAGEAIAAQAVSLILL